MKTPYYRAWKEPFHWWNMAGAHDANPSGLQSSTNQCGKETTINI
jgi:hypothetical protein